MSSPSPTPHPYASSFAEIEANRYQPDICASLCTEWITRMMISEAEGERWRQNASFAHEHSPFYQRHLQEQADLTSIEQIRAHGLIQKVLPVLDELYPDAGLALVQARAPVLKDLNDKTTDRLKLIRIRKLKVLRSASPATLGTLTKEFLKLDKNPRYYLISVRAHDGRSHMIAVVSTKSDGVFYLGGYLYYYDPNMHRVVRWDSRRDLNTFLERTLLSDYQSVNSIWEVAKL
jgi:hypothetical protein